MFKIYELWISLRYLRSRRDDGFVSIVGWFSLIGIALGVATLIIVMSVMNGFRDELLTRIIGLNGHASLYFSDKEISKEYYKDINNSLSNFSEIINITPLVESTVMISNKGSNKGVIVKGISLKDLSLNSLLMENIKPETINLFKEENFIILGNRLASSLQLTVGDTISLISPSGTNTPFGTAPLSKKFVFAGVFDVGMYEYDASVIFMKINDLRNFIGVGSNYIDLIEIKYQDAEIAEKINKKIEDLLNFTQVQNLVLVPWSSRHKQLNNALKVEKNVMFIILTLIILVAAFNIVSSMIMFVRDKQASIAILKTMGMGQYSILRIFILVGSSIGSMGTILGFFIGVIFAKNISFIQEKLNLLTGKDLFAAEIYFLSSLPVKINYIEVLSVLFFSFLISLFATIYPAWRASKIDPVKVLRHV